MERGITYQRCTTDGVDTGSATDATEVYSRAMRVRPRRRRNQDSRRHYYRYLQAQHEVVAHLIKYKERARDREPAEHTITVARVNATLSPCPLCSRLEGLELPRCKRAMHAAESELACLVIILYHAVQHL